MWLILTLASVIALSISQILDKFLVDKKVPNPGVMTFYIALGQTAGVLLVFWNFNFTASWATILLALSSGIAYTVALLFYYTGLKKGEASHLVPFVGGLSPLLIAAIATFSGLESLSVQQFFGIFLASLGTLLISFERAGKRVIFSKGLLFCAVSAVFFSLSWVTVKAGYNSDTFSTVFVLSRAGAFLAALPLLLSKGVRTNLLSKGKRNGGYLPVLALNMFLSIIYYIGIQIAVTLEKASVVAGFATLQYAIFIILVYFISKRFPQIVKEKYFRGEFGQELAAILFIIVGASLLAI